MRNRAGSFSVGRLMEFLTALRRDVGITVRPAPQGAWRAVGCFCLSSTVFHSEENLCTAFSSNPEDPML
jgi:hypothetical protein